MITSMINWAARAKAKVRHRNLQKLMANRKVVTERAEGDDAKVSFSQQVWIA